MVFRMNELIQLLKDCGAEFKNIDKKHGVLQVNMKSDPEALLLDLEDYWNATVEETEEGWEINLIGGIWLEIWMDKN